MSIATRRLLRSHMASAGGRIFSAGYTVKIMPLGDSVVEGMDGSDGQALNGGWRYFLAGLLAAGGYQNRFVGDLSDLDSGARHYDAQHVDHSGHSGWTIQDVADNIDTWLANAAPDVVLLHCGGNDIFGEGVSANTAYNRMNTLLGKIFTYRSTMHVFLTSNLQLVEYSSGIDQYNSQLPGLIAQYVSAGRSAHFVDISSVVPATYQWLPDGFHPGDPGYQIMAQEWYDALIAYDQS